MASKKGKGTAITATVRKLAIIAYNMIQNGESYRPEPLEEYHRKVRIQKIKQFQRTIEKLEIEAHEVVFK